MKTKTQKPAKGNTSMGKEISSPIRIQELQFDGGGCIDPFGGTFSE